MCEALGSSVPSSMKCHREQVSRGVLFLSKPKAHQIKTSRGSSVQSSEQSEPSRTRREGRENTKTAIFISMCDYLYFKG